MLRAVDGVVRDGTLRQRRVKITEASGKRSRGLLARPPLSLGKTGAHLTGVMLTASYADLKIGLILRAN